MQDVHAYLYAYATNKLEMCGSFNGIDICKNTDFSTFDELPHYSTVKTITPFLIVLTICYLACGLDALLFAYANLRVHLLRWTSARRIIYSCILTTLFGIILIPVYVTSFKSMVCTLAGLCAVLFAS